MTITISDKEQKRIFANNLKDALNRSGKQQIEVAKAIGVSQQTFNTWCRGIALPRMGKLERLAAYFGMKKSALIDPPARDYTLKVTKAKRPMFVSIESSDNLVKTARIITPEQERFARKFNKLSKEGQEKVIDYMDFLLEKEKKS